MTPFLRDASRVRPWQPAQSGARRRWHTGGKHVATGVGGQPPNLFFAPENSPCPQILPLSTSVCQDGGLSRYWDWEKNMFNISSSSSSFISLKIQSNHPTWQGFLYYRSTYYTKNLCRCFCVLRWYSRLLERGDRINNVLVGRIHCCVKISVTLNFGTKTSDVRKLERGDVITPGEINNWIGRYFILETNYLSAPRRLFIV